LIEIGSKTAEKNSAQTNRQTNRHYKNNGHLAVNQQTRKKASRQNSCWAHCQVTACMHYALCWRRPCRRWTGSNAGRLEQWSRGISRRRSARQQTAWHHHDIITSSVKTTWRDTWRHHWQSHNNTKSSLAVCQHDMTHDVITDSLVTASSRRQQRHDDMTWRMTSSLTESQQHQVITGSVSTWHDTRRHHWQSRDSI